MWYILIIWLIWIPHPCISCICLEKETSWYHLNHSQSTFCLKTNLDSWKSSHGNHGNSRPFSSKSLKKSQGWLQIASGISLNLTSDWIDFSDIDFPDWAYLSINWPSVYINCRKFRTFGPPIFGRKGSYKITPVFS